MSLCNVYYTMSLYNENPALYTLKAYTLSKWPQLQTTSKGKMQNFLYLSLFLPKKSASSECLCSFDMLNCTNWDNCAHFQFVFDGIFGGAPSSTQ